MLAGLKVSSLAYKCVFYRPELNTKRGHREILKLLNTEMKYTNGGSSKSRWKKWGNLSIYHVYSHSYGP